MHKFSTSFQMSTEASPKWPQVGLGTRPGTAKGNQNMKKTKKEKLGSPGIKETAFFQYASKHKMSKLMLWKSGCPRSGFGVLLKCLLGFLSDILGLLCPLECFGDPFGVPLGYIFGVLLLFSNLYFATLLP